MTALYNEVDAYPAQWLRNLVDAGEIACGSVDERSIEDLEPEDVGGVAQFHAFAGIGGWSYALRLAGWPDDRSIWTGSCPCQPFSTAGRKKGFDDARHLWPAWYRLIAECRPPVVVGEQVASPAGRQWLDVVLADLERADYAVGASDLAAASVGAPHVRQRLYFVAVADGQPLHLHATEREPRRGLPDATRSRSPRGVADADEVGRRADERDVLAGQPDADRSGPLGGLGDAGLERGRRYAGAIPREETPSSRRGQAARYLANVPLTPSPWDGAEWIPCSDWKSRPVEPGLLPVAHGVPARMAKQRAYGNAIVPQVAAAFLRAVMDVLDPIPAR